MAEQTVSVRLRAVTSGFTSAMRGAAGSLSGVQRNAEKLTNVGMGLTKTVTPAILGIGAAAGKVGMDFEHAMSGVSAVTGAGESALASMSEQAQELGRTTQFSATEAAGALEFLGMAGFSAQEATEALPDTLNLAAAGGMELASAADLASNVLQQFALEVDQTQRVTDVLAQTATNSNTSVEQLGQAMQMAGPVANAAGLELEETAAAIGAMGNAGIQASTAGTSLRGALTRLLNASGPAAETIDRLGINAERADGSIRPLPEIIDQLSDSGATAGDMMEIFGQRAGPAMAALVQQGGDALRDLTETVEDSADAAGNMADERMDNLNGDLKELGSAAQGAGIAFYEAGLGDALRTVAQTATEAVQGIGNLPTGLQQTALGFGAIAAAAGPAITGVGMVASHAPAIASNFKSGLTSMRRLAKFMVGPWGVATAAAAAGIMMMIQRSQRMSEMTDTLREDLDGVAASAETLSDEWLINELRQRDVLTTFREMGGDLDTLKAAIAGNSEAQAELNEEFGVGDRMLGEVAQAIPGVRNENSDLARTLGELTGATQDHNEELEAENALLDYLPSAAEQADEGLMGMRGTAAVASGTFAELSSNTNDAAGSTEEMGDEAEDAAEDIDILTSALETLAGTQLDVNETTRAFESAIDDLTDKIDENGDTLDINTEKGRDNQAALDDSVTAAFDHAQAMLDNGESVDDATSAVLGHIDRLREQAIESGLSEDAVDDYIDTLNLTPAEIRTAIALAADQAFVDIADFRNDLDALPSSVTIPIRVTRPGESVGAIHDGAFFTGRGSSALRDHGGNLITAGTPSALAGLAANERARILQVGEEVLAANDPRHIGNIMSARPVAVPAGRAGAVGGDGATQGETVYAPVLNGFGMNEVQDAVRRGIRDAQFQSRTSGR